jgi:PIN domain nuclease of toxin-antitoxin system
MIALDTHVVAWLHAGELRRIPATVRTRLNNEEIGISPMVLLELEYLYATERLTLPADSLFADLEQTIGLKLLIEPFSGIVRESLKLTWTRDPFDRLIAGHALTGHHDLATKDRTIRRHCKRAFWA